MTTKRKRRTRRRLADQLDKHVLYQHSVQAPESDSRFFGRLCKKLTGQPLRTFREDFCGTAALSCEVVKRHRENRAIGVDIHQPTLDWGHRHNLSQLTEHQRQRIELRRADVREVDQPRADLTAALNFSYGVFRTRAELLGYLQSGLRGVRPGGVFMLDVWGGSETQVEQTEERDIDGDDGLEFTYVWDQHKFDPLTYHITCKIHFEFEDGSRMRNAFVYHWRIWTLPELQELFAEAGFENIHVLWEATDLKTGEGNGVYRKITRGDADQSWIAYVVGQRPA